MGNAQVNRWREKAGGGAFWTFKMSWGESKGGEWGFREQVDNGAVIAPAWTSLTRAQISHRLDEADRTRAATMTKSVFEHQAYWNQRGTSQSKKLHVEHRQFADGWHLGWCDARHFFAARADGVIPAPEHSTPEAELETGAALDPAIGADRIGYLDLWVLHRMRAQDTSGGRETAKGDKRAKADMGRHNALSTASPSSSFSSSRGWQWEHGFRKGIADFEAAVRITDHRPPPES